ncbi:hypothetical protein Leryth_010783 [Lithospermum erythrorhizon]|nr:hypothetical protein Leryth_010783 [Lithospermum erythrorhizon]
MATISKLSIASPTYSLTSLEHKSFSSQPKFLIGLNTNKTTFDFKVSSSKLSLSSKNDVLKGCLVVRCSKGDGNGSSIKRTTLHDLYQKEGQSPWYDNLCRPVTDLIPLIESGVRGVTSNPAVRHIDLCHLCNFILLLLYSTHAFPLKGKDMVGGGVVEYSMSKKKNIFQKAISTSNAYNDQFSPVQCHNQKIVGNRMNLWCQGTCPSWKGYRNCILGTSGYDIQDAKSFEPIYDVSDAADGYVSVEVSPRLADDTEGTIEAAKWLHKRVQRPNAYIKIPATAPCIPSIKEVIGLGISVNVTLIFSLARYEAVIDAYLDGLEASGLSDLSRVTSVASFFVSRVDSLVDKLLEKFGTPEALDLRGKAANAQAALAYKLYQKKFSGPRWEALVKKGAKKQRLLWASTSVKNPAYPDTLYVAPLIGPDTVSTMPDQALQAFLDHGKVGRTIDANVSEAEGIYNALEKLGIDWHFVGAQLELEGVDSFKKSFDSLLDSLQEKANSLNLVNL